MHTAHVLLASLLALAAQAQDVLVPCYDVKVATQALKLCPQGREPKLWLILNVNSGPGIVRDSAYYSAAETARKRKVKTVFYIDLKCGGDYSPVIARNGSTWKLLTSATVRNKSVTELRTERDAWRVLYNAPDAWFLDDVPATLSPDLVAELATWNPKLILNPGCAWVPPAQLSTAAVVVSEQAGAWPRTLTPWEAKNRSRCAVIGLSIPSQSLPAFTKSVAGMGYSYASPLDDKWRNGQSAYTSLSSDHYPKLFP